MKKILFSYWLNFLLFIIGSAVAAFGQNANDSLLSIDRIFNSGDFDSQNIGAVRWLKSGEAYTKIEPSASIKGRWDLVSYDAQSGNRSVLVRAERLIPSGADEPLAIQNYDFSADDRKMLIFTNSKRVWRLNTRGDYWVLDLKSGQLTKLGGIDAKPATLMFAKFSPGGTRVGYVRENNLYVETVAGGQITRLTSDGSPTLINGTADWVNEEEFFLRDCWRWSPDGKSVAFWQFDTSGVKNYTLVNDTDELYPKLTMIPYPKTGTPNSAVRVGVVAAGGGPTQWMSTPGDLRQHYIVSMDWAANSDELVMQDLNRPQNDYQLLLADAKSGAVKTLLTEKDDAWVDVRANKFLWTKGGKNFLWMSEKDGWQHLYAAARDGSNLKLITPGKYDVVSLLAVDEASAWVYFIASPENAAQRYLYRAHLDGSSTIPEKITPDAQTGTNSYNIAPNGKWAFHTRSTFTTVPQIELVNLQNKQIARTLVDNAELQVKIDRLQKGKNEFFRLDLGDGLQLDGWMMKPPGFDPNKKYPILFYVYGEPGSQTVTDDWKGSRYLWHLMLTQQGYIVASVENRGTPAPKGHAWRKSVYRRIGEIVSQDQANAASAMFARMPFIDRSRVGIWGWSGGGSSTLNAMFRYPEIYKTGMAVAPVADLRLYDSIYQERYMGVPQDNDEDYKQASAINFAGNLTGNLLIVHGTGDDNVHYQGTERLVNKLVAANKTFTMMAYPNRTHGIFEGENTTRHLYTLLTRYLNEYLPAGPAK